MTVAAHVDAPSRSRPTSARELVWLAGLLAGLGPDAMRNAAALCPLAAEDAVDLAGRSCIDGGSELVLMAGGAARSLHAQARRPDLDGEDDGGQWWTGLLARRGEATLPWRRAIYGRLATGGVAHARRAAASHGLEDAFVRWHARLGPHGHIYSVTDPDDCESAVVAWQLHPGVRPADALAAAGLGSEWRAASVVLDRIHGFAASSTTGPWSVAVTLLGAGTELRIGTSHWARLLDDEGKLRRASTAVAGLGGDGAFVEALWHLLDDVRPTGSFAPLGRALEILVEGDEALGIDVYLAAPRRPRTRRRRAGATTKGARR